MSSTNGNKRGNILVSYLFPAENGVMHELTSFCPWCGAPMTNHD